MGEQGRGSANEAREPGNGGPRVQVTDRRHLARREGEGAAAGAAPAEPPDLRPSYVRQLEEKLSAQERRLREYMERVEAENAAFRARQEREMERRTESLKGEILRAFLPIADDLSRALEAVEGAAEGSATRIAEGLRLIEVHFRSALSSQGVEPVPDVGAPFDPGIHEAVGVVDAEEGDSHGLVVEVVRRGYRLGGALLRPAQVRVGRTRGVQEGSLRAVDRAPGVGDN